MALIKKVGHIVPLEWVLFPNRRQNKIQQNIGRREQRRRHQGSCSQRNDFGALSMINGAGGIDAVQCVFISFYPPLPTDIFQQPGPGFENVNNAPHRICVVWEFFP